MEKLTVHQVHRVAMDLLKKQYPMEKGVPGDVYWLMTRMAILHFVADLQPALEEEIERMSKISQCGVKSEMALLLEEQEVEERGRLSEGLTEAILEVNRKQHEDYL
jgi:hypothetical protein